VKQLAACWALVGANLRRELRTGEALVPMLLFALVVLVVAGFAFDLPALDAEARRHLVPGILWTAIAFAMLVGQARHLIADRDEERWTGLLLAPLDRTLLFGVKWFEGMLLGAALEVVLLPLSVVLFDLRLADRWGAMIGVVALCTASLAALGTLLGSIVARLGRGEALLAILVLPAAAPVLIAGVRSTEAVLAGGGLAAAAPWPAVAAGTLVVYGALGALLFESVLVE
jgi:heme exporter protein CcmB